MGVGVRLGCRFSVVPTRVGVNRREQALGWCEKRCPHTRGGEPLVHHARHVGNYVVPTRVGVNR